MVLVRDARIELAPQPWEGRVLPLNQSRGYNDIILCGHRESVTARNYNRSLRSDSSYEPRPRPNIGPEGPQYWGSIPTARYNRQRPPTRICWWPADLCGHRESNPGVELGRFAFYH